MFLSLLVDCGIEYKIVNIRHLDTVQVKLCCNCAHTAMQTQAGFMLPYVRVYCSISIR
jgi:hypothetical protein